MQSEPIKLIPDEDCMVCRGRGHFYERHEPNLIEYMVCECVFNNAPQDAASQARIDAGDFEIVNPHEQDFDADDFASDDYDPQERMQWDGGDEP